MRTARTASLLEDGILSLFFRLAPSGILGMAISGIYSLVDGIYIGRIVGREGLTAVTLTFPLMVLASGISSLIGVGSASIYSRYLGAKDENRASRVFPLLIALNVVLSGAFAAAIIPFLPRLLVFLGAEGESLRLGARYGAIVLGGAVFGSLQGSTNVLIRAEGRMRTAMIVLASGALLNIALDAVFMIPVRWGVVGAAAATVASQGAGAAIGVWYFLSGKAAARPRLKADGESLRIARGILSVGASALALPLLTLAQSAIILRSVTVYGYAADIPVVGAATRVFQLLAIPLWGISQAYLPGSGTNYGAGRIDRVRRSWRVFTAASTILAFALWIPAMAFPRAFLSLFLNDPALLSWGENNLRAYLISFPALGFLLTTLTLLQSTGRALAASLLTAGKFLLFFVPALLVLVPRIGVTGVFLAAPIADAIVLALCAALLLLDFPGKRDAVRREERRRAGDSRGAPPSA